MISTIYVKLFIADDIQYQLIYMNAAFKSVIATLTFTNNPPFITHLTNLQYHIILEVKVTAVNVKVNLHSDPALLHVMIQEAGKPLCSLSCTC